MNEIIRLKACRIMKLDLKTRKIRKLFVHTSLVPSSKSISGNQPTVRKPLNRITKMFFAKPLTKKLNFGNNSQTFFLAFLRKSG